MARLRNKWLPAVAILALAVVGCGGADGERPDTVDRGAPGPEVADLGSGPYHCDQDAGLELLSIETFETGAANGNWYSNNDVCDACQGLIDMRVGGYDHAAAIDHLHNVNLRGVLDRLLVSLDDETLRAAVRVELERLVAELGRWLERPELTLYHPYFAPLQATLEDYAKSELDEDTLLACRDTLQDMLAYLREQLPPCRARCEVTQSPTPVFAKPVPAESIPGGRCGSEFALHVLAGPLTDWGGTVGATLGPPLDGTDWEGIAFWARVGTGSRTPIRLEVAEKHTAEKYIGEDGGPICNPDHTDDTVETGCDKFGINLQLSHDWKLYTVPFDELRQKGWGLRAPYFDVSGILSVAFQFERGEWDIWLDDVAVYRRIEP